MTPLILDSHIDIRWPDPPDWLAGTAQCVDLPKLRAGGVGARSSAGVVWSPPSTPTAQAWAEASVSCAPESALGRAVISGEVSSRGRRDKR
ncbi:MAG: hypothetical protein ACK44F_11925, partial [Roseococcus sp.]